MSFNNRLGMTESEDGRSIVLDANEEHLVAPDTVHFAVLATLGEVSAAQAVAKPVVPVAVSLQLMSRARAQRLTARGKVLKSGRSLAFAEGEVTQGDKLVAKVTVTFALI
ncbi:MAG: PaaI family thioesterase [bacterium]|nr:PaaI family thioesterase [bacterium]